MYNKTKNRLNKVNTRQQLTECQIERSRNQVIEHSRNQLYYQTLLFIGILTITIGCNSQKQLTPAQQEVVNQAKANFLFVEGGSFMIGIEGFREDTKPYQATLSSYSISKYETTFKEYDVYHNIIGKEIVGKDMRGVIKDYGENYGVKRVTWQEARNYCQWLGKQLNLPIDLPTEAQWEYAARSRGKIVEHATNNGKIEGGKYEEDNYGFEEVGSYPPNPLGLYDMSGGRPEWVLDWYAWYSKEPKTNPIQDTIQYSDSKVVRGLHKLRYSVYTRVKRKPDNNGTGVGFRCVCNQETPVQ